MFVLDEVLWDGVLVAGHMMVARHLISPMRLEKM
jgi:hypothetical protein